MIKKGFSAKKKFEQNPEVEKNMLIPAVLISEETSNTKGGMDPAHLVCAQKSEEVNVAGKEGVT